MPIYGVPDAAFLVDAKTAARLSNDAQRALDAEVDRVRELGVTVAGRLLQGDPREVIPPFAAQEAARLLVVGTHGRRGLGRMLLGSVAESIVRVASVPVVVVRRPTPDATASRSS